MHFLNENVWISIKVSLNFVTKGPINNIPALGQIMAWRRPGDKPLSEPMLVSLLTHICVTRPNWVNNHGYKCHLPMMTSSNRNICRVTGPLCGEFTGPGDFPAQKPVTRSFDVFFDLRPNKRLSKQPWGWWFETLSWSLWRHCNAGLQALIGGCNGIKRKLLCIRQILVTYFH